MQASSAAIEGGPIQKYQPSHSAAAFKCVSSVHILSQLPWVAGRRPVIIEVVSVSDDSEEEQEDVETPDIKRRNRWRRVAQAATKQSLRLRAVHAATHPDTLCNSPPGHHPGCCENDLNITHILAAALRHHAHIECHVMRLLAGAPLHACNCLRQNKLSRGVELWQYSSMRC